LTPALLMCYLCYPIKYPLAMKPAKFSLYTIIH
jgi:hypothetical protein